jgi:hypothetical protein
MAVLTAKRLAEIIKSVPEKKFRIATLAPQLLDDQGQVDVVKCVENQGELNAAIIEIQSYVKSAQNALSALSNIGGKKLAGECFNWPEDDNGE